MSQFVYFIRPIGERGPVKIGCGQNPMWRKSEISQRLPFGIEIAASTPGDFVIERRLHAKFRDAHIGHEWFTWSPALQRMIDDVKNGRFDPSTLPAPMALTKGRSGKPKAPYLKTVHEDQSVTYAKCRFIPLSEIASADLSEPILEAAE